MIHNKKLEHALQKVQKPGRYVGGELNSVVKDPSQVEVRFAFCFPDTYEIGMSHLGIKILYGAMNEIPYFWCERVFAPWVDMEEEMRREDIPLYALESGDPVSDFDFIGFTLQYELSYTNVLNMLELAGIPLRSKDRTELRNIVVGGGPCACNPEPLADFFDIFFLGDGEEVDIEVMELYRQCKKEGKSKLAFLEQAAQIQGVYVPAFYDVTYNEDGTVKAYTPTHGVPATVKKRNMMDMDKSYYPKDFVVPLIDVVHNRISEEVLRGCIRGCRFCQAGFLYRPYREKSIETIDRQCRDLCCSTGYDEISLSSLSTSDYSQLNQLIDTLHQWTEGPVGGGLAAGLGSALYDMTNPAYITSAPFTFAFKFMLAAVCGWIAWAKGSRAENHGQNILAAIAGSATYMVLYLGKSFIEGMLLGSALGPVLLSVATKAVTSGVNAVIAVIVSVPLCAAIRLALKKSHLLEKLG